MPHSSSPRPHVPRFWIATDRWQEYKRPSTNIVVEVATETYAQETLCILLIEKRSFLDEICQQKQRSIPCHVWRTWSYIPSFSRNGTWY